MTIRLDPARPRAYPGPMEPLVTPHIDQEPKTERIRRGRPVRSGRAPSKAKLDAEAITVKGIAAEAKREHAAAMADRNEIEARRLADEQARHVAIQATAQGAAMSRERAIVLLSWSAEAAMTAGDYKAIPAAIDKLADIQAWTANKSTDALDELARRIKALPPAPPRPAREADPCPPTP